MHYAVFSTRLGLMAVAGSFRGVAGVALPSSDLSSSLDRLCVKVHAPPANVRETSPADFGTLPDRLAAFMEGERVVFDDTLDRSGWTDFRARVWDATRHIPYGETRSYSWVASAAGQPTACRATGQAMHHNPVPIIVPCHRVVGAGGELTGFDSGLELKEKLLTMESGDAPIHIIR